VGEVDLPDEGWTGVSKPPTDPAFFPDVTTNADRSPAHHRRARASWTQLDKIHNSDFRTTGPTSD
jgi:hypothetical protein